MESKLFSPFDIRGVTFRNRVGVAPMTRVSSSKDGIPRKDVFDFLIRRARNDAALVYTEAILTDYESAQGYPNQSRLVTQRQIDAWGPVVRAIEEAGAVAVMQMFHCGRVAWPEINPANRTIAPSPVAPKQNNTLTGNPYPVPDEMSPFDIKHAIEGFIATARGAVAAGFQGVEIHGAHGYLVNSFLSTYSNRRTDAWGGSVENRFRFAREIIRRVREAMPDDRLLFFRISNWGVADPEVSLFEKAEWEETIRLLDREPLDAISVSTMDYSARAFDTGMNMAQLTREHTGKPVFICGRIFDRDTAEEAIDNADMVLSAKSLLLNPNWVQDIRDRKPLKTRTNKESNIAYTGEPLP